MRRIRTGVAALLAMMLIVLAGCQSVGGVDIAQVVKQSLNVKSVESKETLTLKLNVNKEAKLNQEDEEMIALLNGLQIDLHTMKESNEKMSAKGELKLKDKTLPFHIIVDTKNIALDVKGAKEALVIPITEVDPSMAELTPDVKELEAFQQALVQWFTKNAPNPKTINVTSGMENVFGESKYLDRIHLEFGADETLGWIQGFVKAVLADEEGTKAFLEEVGKLYGPIVSGLMEQDGMESMEGMDMFKDGELFAAYAFKWLKENGETMLNELTTSWEQAVKDSPELAQVLSDKTKLKLDLYSDSAKNIHKSVMELNIQLPTAEDMPVTSISVQTTSELKNHNNTVKVEPIDISKAVNVVEQEMTPGEWLRFFEDGSLAKDMLLQSGITNKFVYLPIAQDEYDEWLNDSPLPYVDKGVTMVPLRYVAEELDAEVKWDSKQKQVTMIDDLTGSKIVLKLGSNIALVDNVEKKISGTPVMSKEGNVYVPLRSVSELLGAKVQYEGDAVYGSYVTIERS